MEVYAELTMYECHVTIEPVLNEEKLKELREICHVWGFKVADLFMRRRENDTEERSKNDTFMTGHDSDFICLQNKMIYLIDAVKAAKHKVWRYKIENIIIDSKYQGDHLKLLKENE